MESHSRSPCDIVTSPETKEKQLEKIAKTGLFDDNKTCVLEILDVS
jgi:hypothetical protein